MTSEEYLATQNNILTRIELYAKVTAENVRKMQSGGGVAGGKAGAPVGNMSANIGGLGTAMKEAGQGVGEFAKGVSSLAAALLKFAIVPNTGDKLISFLSRLSKVMDGKQLEGLQPFGEFLVTLEGVMLGFAVNLARASSILAKVGEKGVDVFLSTINRVTEGFKNIDQDALMQGAQAVQILKGSLFGFALSLALSAPLFIIGFPGAILFGLTLAVIMTSFKLIGGDENTIAMMNALKNLGIGIAILGLSVFAYSKLVSVGDVLFFSFTLLALITPLMLLDALGQRLNKNSKDSGQFIGGVGGEMQKIGFGLLIMGLSIFAFDKLVEPAAVIKTVLFMTGLGLAMMLWGSDRVVEGVDAFMKAGIAIVVLGLSIFAFDKLVGGIDSGRLIKMGIIIVGVGIAFGIVGLMEKQIKKGAISLAIAGLSLIALGFGVKMFTDMTGGMSKENLLDLLFLGVAVVGIGLSFMLIGNFATQVILGSVAMMLVGASLIVVGFGAGKFYENIPDNKWESLGFMLATVGGLGLTFAAAGIPPVSVFIMMGAAAMIVAGAALITISYGLKKFKESGFTQVDSKNLAMAMAAVKSSIGGVGGEESDGFLSSLVSSVSGAAQAPLIMLNSAAMMVAGAALIVVSKGLKAFKNVGFVESDTINMKRAIEGVADAFAYPFSDEAKAKGLNPLKMMAGIYVLKDAGDTLVNLAKGVQAFANLNFIRYEVKDGKIVPAEVIPLTEEDFDRASYGMAKVVSAIAEPFAKVGRAELGESVGQGAGSQLIKSIFGGGYVSAGVGALKGAGNILVGMAKGVKAFANLQFTEYEIVNAGTPDAKMVPKSITPLTEEMINTSVRNMVKVITAVGAAFAQVGKMEAAGEGVFSGGFVKKGVNALKGSQKTLIGLAKAIPYYAQMQFLDYEVVNPGTPNAKVVPKGYVQITEPMIQTAVRNITGTLLVVAQAFAEIGRMEDEGDSWFSDGMVKKGVDALKGTGKILVRYAKSVQNFAFMKFTETDSEGKPTGAPVQLTPALVAQAVKNMKMTLLGATKAVSSVGLYIQNNQDSFKVGAVALPEINKALKTSASVIKKFIEDVDEEKSKSAGKSIYDFITNIYKVWSEERDPKIREKHKFLGVFTTNVERLSEKVDMFENMADSFERIAESMGEVTSQINKMELEKLKEVAKVFEGAATLVKDETTNTFQFITNPVGVGGGETQTDGGFLGNVNTGETATIQQGGDNQAAEQNARAIAALASQMQQLLSAINGLPPKIGVAVGDEIRTNGSF